MTIRSTQANSPELAKEAASPYNLTCPCGSGLEYKKCCGNGQLPSENVEKSNGLIEKEASLDNKTINCVSTQSAIDTFPPEQRVNWNNAYSAKISNKARQSFDIRRAIASFFTQGVADPETGEWLECDLRDYDKRDIRHIFSDTYYENLYRYYYRLGLNDSLYAEFDNGLGLKTTQIIATKYSMHNLCPVWGYRKAKIIRKRYKDYFNSNPELLQNYHPCHMVLTLRHNEQGYFIGDKFIGKRFFARELIEQFKEFRDNHRKAWKDLVYGGCYNVEVKKSKNDNGIHVHMHCLVLQNKNKTVNEAREWIKTNWEKQTGASKVHYETLYYYDHEKKRKVENHSVVEEIFDEESGTYGYTCPEIEVPSKNYYNDSWSVDQTSRAILEALKYNFKPDALIGQDGELDIPFIAEILNQSKGLRFTSRFNALYRVKELNFAEIGNDQNYSLDINDHILAGYVMGKADEYALEVEEISEETFHYPQIDFRNTTEIGYSADFETFMQRFPEIIDIVKQRKAQSLFDYVDVEKSYSNLINPFNREEALYEDFKIVLAFPHTIQHNSPNHQFSRAPRHRPDNYYQVAQETSSIKELTKALMMSHYNQILIYEDHDRFNVSLQNLIQLRL